MENKEISKHLKLLSQLMDIHQQNPFKIKSIANSAFKIDRLPFKLKDKSAIEIETLEGIGKSTAAKIAELLKTGGLTEIDELIKETPPGVVDMLGIKGLGPKKIEIIWHQLNIETIGELYYACNENRLVEAKGFGEKTQQEIKKAIEFKMASLGSYLYAVIEPVAYLYLEKFLDLIERTNPGAKVQVTGDFRRKLEVIQTLEFLFTSATEINPDVFTELDLIATEVASNFVKFKDAQNISIVCHFAQPHEAALKLFQTTGNPTHVQHIEALIKDKNGFFSTEDDIYIAANVAFIEPELREGLEEISLGLNNKLPQLITFQELKGTLHNHSTWSDGIHTIEEMAIFCRDKMGLEYLGMCDHSKTAVYANGLSIERVLQQHEEIEHLNKKLAPFKIFKGIESDILSDGSLDYPDEILKKFDFVVASVHSNLKMNEERATARLIKAIENPYTTILGHPTGRLLLARSGYPLDFEKIIDACAANNVVIEINANPFRLDLDWRWHQYAIKKGVLLSINPDAHRNEGFFDMHYGINVARKGGLTKTSCLNTFELDHLTDFFLNKKKE